MNTPAAFRRAVLALGLAVLGASATGCTGSAPTVAAATKPCPAPVSTVPGTPAPATSRATPEGAVCALVAALQTGDCEGVYQTLTEEGADALNKAAGDRTTACDRLRTAQAVTASNVLATATSTGEREAKVTLTVNAKDGRIDSASLTLIRTGETWKLRRLPST